MEYYEAVGRRKTATARVRLFPGGEGHIVVNDKALADYFGRENDILVLTEPLKVTAMESRFNISVRVKGGGMTGQSGAIRLGIARALLKVLFPKQNGSGAITCFRFSRVIVWWAGWTPSCIATVVSWR